jgi:hypothetical protein
MSPSVLAVILGCVGLAEQVGEVGGLAVGPSGAFMPGGCALMLMATPGTLVVVFTVIGHLEEPIRVFASSRQRRRRFALLASGECAPATSRLGLSPQPRADVTRVEKSPRPSSHQYRVLPSGDQDGSGA